MTEAVKTPRSLRQQVALDKLLHPTKESIASAFDAMQRERKETGLTFNPYGDGELMPTRTK
jgi:hypothetical protein